MATRRRGLRVIAGSAGGRALVGPRGGGARPTTDRVKESLFGALGPACIHGAVVLDLFAGSGALAIEALSRGAQRALLVDRDPAAAESIGRNLATTGFVDRARVERRSVAAVLRARPPPDAPFDLVFLDPPYDTSADELADALAQLASPGWLVPGATVVVERAAKGGAVPLPATWATAWERSYGDTLVLVATADA